MLLRNSLLKHVPHLVEWYSCESDVLTMQPSLVSLCRHLDAKYVGTVGHWHDGTLKFRQAESHTRDRGKGEKALTELSHWPTTIANPECKSFPSHFPSMERLCLISLPAIPQAFLRISLHSRNQALRMPEPSILLRPAAHSGLFAVRRETETYLHERESSSVCLNVYIS